MMAPRPTPGIAIAQPPSPVSTGEGEIIFIGVAGYKDIAPTALGGKSGEQK